jgi:hypothetical protein
LGPFIANFEQINPLEVLVLSETVKVHFHLSLGDIYIFSNVETFSEKIRRMVAIYAEQIHSSALEATGSNIVFLGFLIKLRRILAIETEYQTERLFFTFRTCQSSIHTHKMLELHSSLDLWYVAIKDRDS